MFHGLKEGLLAKKLEVLVNKVLLIKYCCCLKEVRVTYEENILTNCDKKRICVIIPIENVGNDVFFRNGD